MRRRTWVCLTMAGVLCAGYVFYRVFVSPEYAFLRPSLRGRWIVHPEPQIAYRAPRTCPDALFAHRFAAGTLPDHFSSAYAASNVVVAAAGNLEHTHVRELVERVFAPLATTGAALEDRPPRASYGITVRTKDLEQAHVVVGTPALAQRHADRFVSYILNTVLGGSMSSRLFQNVREKRGLAYAVFSGLNAYRDAGTLTVYAGCSAASVGQVVDLVIEELKGLKTTPVTPDELRRAKDHLKGSLMLSLENTASRMSHLARQEIYFERQSGLDETLDGIEQVAAEDVRRVANQLFTNGSLAATVLGPPSVEDLAPSRLSLS